MKSTEKLKAMLENFQKEQAEALEKLKLNEYYKILNADEQANRINTEKNNVVEKYLSKLDTELKNINGRLEQNQKEINKVKYPEYTTGTKLIGLTEIIAGQNYFNKSRTVDEIVLTIEEAILLNRIDFVSSVANYVLNQEQTTEKGIELREKVKGKVKGLYEKLGLFELENEKRLLLADKKEVERYKTIIGNNFIGGSKNIKNWADVYEQY